MNPKFKPIIWQGLLLLSLTAVILAAGLYLGRAVGPEGAIREGICQELLAGHTAGRQGAVSSVWWGPFPTLAILPVAFLLPASLMLPACLVVSALFGAATLVLLEQALRLWGAGRWRWLLVAGVGVNPAFLETCWAGSSFSMVTCLLVLSLYSITTWVAQRRLLDLVWFAFGIALLVGTGYEVSGWVLAAVCVVMIEEGRRGVDRAEKGAVLWVAFLPLVYMAGLWWLMCWLIMGDPLYAVRSLGVAGPGPGDSLILPDYLWLCFAGLAVLVSWMLVLALRRHDRSGVCLAVLGLALPGAAGLMAWCDRLWDAAPLILALLPAAVLAVGHWLASPSCRIRQRVGVWCLAGLPLVLATLCPLAIEAGRPDAQTGPQEIAPISWLPNLERHIRRQTPFAKVFVCGFGSFSLLQSHASPLFEHSLDFNFDEAKQDYHGQVIYLLVHRADQRNAMDSIHWKCRNIYIQGTKETLYDSDWGDWRLFELIQATLPR